MNKFMKNSSIVLLILMFFITGCACETINSSNDKSVGDLEGSMEKENVPIPPDDSIIGKGNFSSYFISPMLDDGVGTYFSVNYINTIKEGQTDISFEILYDPYDGKVYRKAYITTKEGWQEFNLWENDDKWKETSGKKEISLSLGEIDSKKKNSIILYFCDPDSDLMKCSCNGFGCAKWSVFSFPLRKPVPDLIMFPMSEPKMIQDKYIGFTENQESIVFSGTDASSGVVNGDYIYSVAYYFDGSKWEMIKLSPYTDRIKSYNGYFLENARFSFDQTAQYFTAYVCNVDYSIPGSYDCSWKLEKLI